MKNMTEVGIRALKQNASAVVAEAASGETVVITDHGRPVAQLSPISASPLERMVAAGRARPPKSALRDLPEPSPGPELSAALAQLRETEHR
jgi:prevent-host-death family protein